MHHIFDTFISSGLMPLFYYNYTLIYYYYYYYYIFS